MLVATGTSAPVIVSAASSGDIHIPPSAFTFASSASACELWSVQRPHLYNTEFTLLSSSSSPTTTNTASTAADADALNAVDAVNVTGGAKTVHFDANTGMYLNGQRLKLR